jgi:hypothetical protein
MAYEDGGLATVVDLLKTNRDLAHTTFDNQDYSFLLVINAHIHLGMVQCLIENETDVEKTIKKWFYTSLPSQCK